MALSNSALCSLPELKSYLGLDASAATYDAALEALIEACSIGAESHTRRQLTARDQEWDLSGDGSAFIFVPEWPVNSVAELTLNGAALSPRAGVTSPSGYVIDAEAGLIQLMGLEVFGAGIANVHLEANCGYNPVPADLKQAVIEWAAWRLKESGIAAVGGNLLGQISKQLPSDAGTVTYWSSGLTKDIPPAVRTVLDRYGRTWAA